MFRSKSLPIFRAASKALRPVQQRQYLWRPWWWDRTDTLTRFERHFNEMERDFNRFWRVVPSVFDRSFIDLTPRRGAADLEHFHLDNPIVEEDGKKKFKLVFDASHFKPTEITVKTTGGRLSIKAKHEAKDNECEEKYEFQREYAIPKGVKAEEVTCKYTNEGHLIVEAPYTPPAIESKEQEISVKHE